MIDTSSNSRSEDNLLSLLHDGERCLGEARVSLRRSIKLKGLLQEAGHRLMDVLSMMQAQGRAIAKLLHWTWDYNSTLSLQLQALLAQDQPFIHIDEVCHQLENTKVHAQLVAGEQGHTLFDFVDDTSIASLKLQAQVDLKEMLALHEKGVSAQMVLEERLLYFQQVISTLDEGLGAPSPTTTTTTQASDDDVGAGNRSMRRTLLEDCEIWRYVVGNVTEQAEIIDRMKVGLLVAASAYSRTTRMTITGGSGPPPATTTERPRSPASEERELLALLQVSIHRMKNLHVQMDRMPQRVHTIRQQMRALLADFESFHPEATERIAALKNDQLRFTELGENVHAHLQELASLAAFYSQFQSAYSHLGGEIGRRRRSLEGVAQVIQEAQEKLDRLHKKEEKERATFYHQYGRYLPASLCPVIQEPPEVFYIRPDVEEVMARLPLVESTMVPTTDPAPFSSSSPHQPDREGISRPLPVMKEVPSKEEEEEEKGKMKGRDKITNERNDATAASSAASFLPSPHQQPHRQGGISRPLPLMKKVPIQGGRGGAGGAAADNKSKT